VLVVVTEMTRSELVRHRQQCCPSVEPADHYAPLAPYSNVCFAPRLTQQAHPSNPTPHQHRARYVEPFFSRNKSATCIPPIPCAITMLNVCRSGGRIRNCTLFVQPGVSLTCARGQSRRIYDFLAAPA